MRNFWSGKIKTRLVYFLREKHVFLIIFSRRKVSKLGIDFFRTENFEISNKIIHKKSKNSTFPLCIHL